MPDTPLNPDALEAASREVFREVLGFTKTQATRTARRAVSAYLAAALPEVTSAEGLDQLPLGSTVLGADMIAYQMLLDESFADGKSRKTWWATGNEFEATSIPLPARVLNRPGVKP